MTTPPLKTEDFFLFHGGWKDQFLQEKDPIRIQDEKECEDVFNSERKEKDLIYGDSEVGYIFGTDYEGIPFPQNKEITNNYYMPSSMVSPQPFHEFIHSFRDNVCILIILSNFFKKTLLPSLGIPYLPLPLAPEDQLRIRNRTTVMARHLGGGFYFF